MTTTWTERVLAAADHPDAWLIIVGARIYRGLTDEQAAIYQQLRDDGTDRFTAAHLAQLLSCATA